MFCPGPGQNTCDNPSLNVTCVLPRPGGGGGDGAPYSLLFPFSRRYHELFFPQGGTGDVGGIQETLIKIIIIEHINTTFLI